MLPTVDCQHNRGFCRRSKVDRIGKPLEDRSANFAVNSRKGQRLLRDPMDKHSQCFAETPAEPRRTRLVPFAHFHSFGLGLRPEDDRERHGLSEQLRTHHGPRHAAAWIGKMFGPPSVKLGPISVGQRELGLPLRVAQTFPKGHRQISTIRGRQLQQLGQRTGRHRLIVAFRPPSRNQLAETKSDFGRLPVQRSNDLAFSGGAQAQSAATRG